MQFTLKLWELSTVYRLLQAKESGRYVVNAESNVPLYNPPV